MARVLILAALGLTLLVAAQAGPPHKTETKNQAAEKRQQAPTPPATPPQSYRPYADYNHADCYRDTDHDAADLCAQWRAAIAAEKAAGAAQWGVVIAGIGALLSFASIILVLMALHQGRDANRINMKEAGRNTRRTIAGAKDTKDALTVARRNAKAAAALVKASEDTAKHQLRAYLGIEDFGFEISSKEETYEPADLAKPGIFTDFVSIYVRNFGATPAFDVELYLSMASTPFLMGLTADHDFESGSRPRSSSILTSRYFIHSGQTECIKTGIDPSAVWEANRKEVFLHLWGRIYYRDAFEEPHSTKFYVIWEPWQNRFSPGDRFNGEDSVSGG